MTFDDMLDISFRYPGTWFTRKEALGLWAIRVGYPSENIIKRAKRAGMWQPVECTFKPVDLKADDWMVTTDQVYDNN